MALERNYTIPLRREWSKTPRYRRAKKAASAVREFLKKHMKSESIKIGKHLNLELWKHGIKNPPHKIKITAVKEDDGTVKAELFGKKYEEAKKPEKKEEKPSGVAGKLQSAIEKTKGGEKAEPEEEEKAREETAEDKTGKKEKKEEKKETAEKKPEGKKEAGAKPAAKGAAEKGKKEQEKAKPDQASRKKAPEKKKSSASSPKKSKQAEK